jgi:hypothetical protein
VAEIAIAVHHPADTFVGRQITALVRVDAATVVLELGDGSQLQFRAKDGALEVGAHLEAKH